MGDLMRTLGLLFAVLFALLPAAGWAQTIGRPLRVGLVTNGIYAVKDPATGELRGVGVELARALAARLGRPLELSDYPNDPSRLAALRAGAIDVTSAAITPELTGVLDFTAVFMETDNTFLVPDGSPIKRVADADRPGLRIAAARGGAPALYLGANYKQATLVEVPTAVDAAQAVRSGQADAAAANRQQWIVFAGENPGVRVLDDAFAVQRHAFGVPKGSVALFAEVSGFVDEARATGQVQAAITKTGVLGVRVVSTGGAAPAQLPRSGGAPRGLPWAAGLVVLAAGVGARLRRRRLSAMYRPRPATLQMGTSNPGM